MSTTVNCPACGRSVAPESRFCGACGAQLPAPPRATPPAASAESTEAAAPIGELATAAASAPPRPLPPAAPSSGSQPASRLDQLGPGAGDFAGILLRFVRSPGVLTASLAAAIAAGVTLVFGLLVAIAFPTEHSIIGGSLAWGENGDQVGVVTRAFRQMVATLLVPFSASGVDGLRPTPAAFVLVPLAAVAFASAREGRRLRHLPARQRLAWGAGTAVPFALVMLLPLLMSGYLAPSFGWTLLASLAWGGSAGAVGAWWAIRRDAPETLDGLVPVRATPILTSARAVLGPLAVVLVATTVIGTSAWILQTVRDVDGVKGGRSLLTTTVEDVLYAGGHGIHYAELGATAAFRLPQGEGPSVLGLVLPVTKTSKLYGDGSSHERYRLFDYHRPLPPWAFLLLTALLLAIPTLLALYAGFALARARAAATPLLGAAWGALVGPAWALTMVLLDAVLASNAWFGEELFGAAVGDSVLVRFLVGGAIVGAVGGLLATAGALGAEIPAKQGDATHA